MDSGVKCQRKVHPKERANCLSWVTFFYTFKIFKKGYSRDLLNEDLYQVLSSCKSKDVGDLLENAFHMDKKQHDKVSFWRVMWTCFGKTYLKFGLIQLLMRIVVILIIPEATGKLISYFTPGQTAVSRQQAFMYAALVIIFSTINHVYSQNYMMALTEFGIKIRTAICSLIYRKTLRMTEASLSEITMGKIVTLITKDVAAVEMLILFGNDIWIGLVQTALICFLIYQKIGVAAFAGVGFFLIVLPLQLLIGKMATVYRLKTSKKTDERLQLTQDTLASIKIIKMYAWERFFGEKISEARKKEVNSIFALFYMKVVILILGGLSSKIAFYLLIMTYVWLGNFITAELVYFIHSCFGKLRHVLNTILPLGVTFGAEFSATVIRLKSVLEAEEIPMSHPDRVEKTARITVRNLDLKIKSNTIFKNVCLNIDHNGLVAVIGHLGCGKSTFLKLLLQNYQVNIGEAKVQGRVSYASQEPWLFPSTVRNNILFGQPMVFSRYSKVLEICDLNRDLETLDLKDQTIVGDRGINLSKGQQARINLARAVYKQAEIYLLDDCLASLDSRVSDFIFEECIQKFLRDKICLFVTNNLEHVKGADRVLEIANNKIEFLKKESVRIEAEPEQEQEFETVATTEEPVKGPSKDLYKEFQYQGNVPLDVYRKYAQFGGGFWICALIVLMFASVQSAVSYSDKLVSNWVTLEQNLSSYKALNLTETLEFSDVSQKRTWILNLYTIIIVSSTLLSLVKSITFFAFNRRASITLHKVMLSKILGARMRFFDSTFIGNILNRFAKDLSNLDEHLPIVMNHCLELTFVVLGVIFLVASVNAIFLVPIAVFGLLAGLVTHIYQRTGRSLQRLEASTRSPLMGHLGASLDGLTTIRAFGAQELIKEEFDRHQDLYTSASYTLQNSLRALSFVLDCFCTVFITLVIGRFLLIPNDTSVGNVGLAISQSFTLTGLLQYGIRRWADFVNYMTSVQRSLEYANTEQETDSEPKDPQALNKWPEAGQIRYDDVSLSFNSTTKRQALRNINFHVGSLQKIGIVGRTGAGKSSLVSALFRLYEVDSGTILIDGIDTRSVRLGDLRRSLAIIPQDPVIFTGTIRENIDPFSARTDEELWSILKTVRLDKAIGNLSDRVECGNNDFSSGQKQLMCLARAIARRNRIIVLDEATANLDEETDGLVRGVIEEKFSGKCTLIVIAHRLSSVTDANQVMVVDDGQIVEMGRPSDLLADKDSLFSKMVN